MPKKTNTTPAAPPPKVEMTLSKEQEFYIKGNMEVLSEKQIAADLGLPQQVISEYAETVQRDSRTSRVSSLMQRPTRGVVAMTEAASMVADDFKNKGMITQAEINRAAANGDYRLAAELAERKETQQHEGITQQQTKYSGCWHFIREPGDEPPIDKRK